MNVLRIKNDLVILEDLIKRVDRATKAESHLRVTLLKSVCYDVDKYIHNRQDVGCNANVRFFDLKHSLDKTIRAECAELGIAVDRKDYGFCSSCGDKMDRWGCKHACECCGVCSH